MVRHWDDGSDEFLIRRVESGLTSALDEKARDIYDFPEPVDGEG